MRAPNWDTRLAAFIEARRNTPFAWGSHDCAMFAGDAVIAITGRDPFAAWRGTYDCEETGSLVQGGAPLSLIVDGALRAFGAAPVPPEMAQRGDVVMLMLGNAETCGVCLGGSVAAPGLDRLRFAKPSGIVKAWAI